MHGTSSSRGGTSRTAEGKENVGRSRDKTGIPRLGGPASATAALSSTGERSTQSRKRPAADSSLAAKRARGPAGRDASATRGTPSSVRSGRSATSRRAGKRAARGDDGDDDDDDDGSSGADYSAAALPFLHPVAERLLEGPDFTKVLASNPAPKLTDIGIKRHANYATALKKLVGELKSSVVAMCDRRDAALGELASIEGQLRRDKDDMAAKRVAFERQQAELDAARSHQQAQIDSLKASLGAEQAENKVKTEALFNATARVEELEGRMEESDEAMANLHDSLERSTSRVTALEAELADIKAELAEQVEALSESDQRIKEMKAEAEAQAAEAEARLSALRSKSASAAAEQEQRTAELVEQAQEEASAARAEAATLEASLSQLRTVHSEVEARLAEEAAGRRDAEAKATRFEERAGYLQEQIGERAPPSQRTTPAHRPVFPPTRRPTGRHASVLCTTAVRAALVPRRTGESGWGVCKRVRTPPLLGPRCPPPPLPAAPQPPPPTQMASRLVLSRRTALPAGRMEHSNKEVLDTLRESKADADTRAKEAMDKSERLQAEANDAKGRLAELQTASVRMEGELSAVKGEEARLRSQLSTTDAALQAATKDLEEARASVHRLEGEVKSAAEALDKASSEAAARTASLEERLDEAQGQAASAEENVERLTKELEAAKAALAQLKEEKEAASALARSEAARADSLGGQLAALRDAVGQTQEQQASALVTVTADRDGLRCRLARMEDMERRLNEAEAEAAALRDDVYELQMTRRGLHNKIQDMRGAIRVYVRVRPVLSGDLEAEEKASLKGDGEALRMAMDDVPTAVRCSVDGETLELCANTTRLTKAAVAAENAKAERRAFKFDTVFGPSATQQDVFDDVSMFVQSALDGFQVCLFSYGQTGSGKTHTMQGGAGDGRGLIPRSVEQILKTTREMRRQGWVYTLEASFLEIYNETVRDLLDPAAGSAAKASFSSAGSSSSSSSSSGRSLPIHFDAKTGQADVPGLTKRPVDCTSAIDDVLSTAAASRSVASTSMNAVSSRSHSVFTLHIRGENSHKGVVVRGKLNLCDLAGSERLARSQAEGSRLRETQSINKSLSNLADVFTSLAKNSSHVPFRNSKLTHLLQPCFRGDGKTLMLVSLSPTTASAHESLCSLRFASQVATVQSGQAKKQISASQPGAAAAGAAAGAETAGDLEAAPAPASSASVSATPVRPAAPPSAPSSVASSASTAASARAARSARAGGVRPRPALGASSSSSSLARSRLAAGPSSSSSSATRRARPGTAGTSSSSSSSTSRTGSSTSRTGSSTSRTGSAARSTVRGRTAAAGAGAGSSTLRGSRLNSSMSRR
ncbi:KIN14H [Symbiodinium sp. KB8]|nr:KIN14H [Symbiodinium sp. KB8]